MGDMEDRFRLKRMVNELGMVAIMKMLADIAKDMAKEFPETRSCHNNDARLITICATAVQANFEHNVMRNSEGRRLT